MANEVKLPRLGQGMESGTIIKWLKVEGDEVEKGEPLYELDTDKVTQEVEADVAGVLLRIDVKEGEVPVGETIAVIGERGEQVSAPEPKGNGEPEGDETGPAPPATETGGDGAEESAEKPAEAPKREPERERGREAFHKQIAESRASSGNGGRVKASPLARRIARERGIDIRALRGTGPEGRIVAEDVERSEAGAAATGTGAAPAEVERQPLSSTRRTIARRLTEAWTIPAFQISMSADMARAQSLQKRFRATGGDEAPKTTVTDILTKACAAALMRHRAVNARFAEDAIELLPNADIGLAVAIPDGLVVPIIRAAERLTLAELAAARADIVTRARAGKLQRGDLEGGSFTISNLGMYGVEQFVAVLNPPQAAILAVGAIQEQVVAREGEVEVAPQLTLTLTCDHRTVDGATASEFLGAVKAFLEEPGLML